VYDALKQAIVHCELLPRHALREKELSEQFDVSRTPIREALLQLEQDGLVEIFPHSGTRVASISLEAVRESHFIREAMETATVAFAAQHGTPQLNEELAQRLQQYEGAMTKADAHELFAFDELFHRTIAEFRFQNRLWKITNAAKAHMDRVRHLTLPLPVRIQEIAAEHRRITEQIVAGNPALAVEAMREHLNKVFTDVEAIRGDFPEYFVE
jgi:DNA-binding GntR family transcriptional regulator